MIIKSKLIETQGKLIETQGKLIETQGKLIETQGKLIETQGKMSRKRFKEPKNLNILVKSGKKVYHSPRNTKKCDRIYRKNGYHLIKIGV